MELFKLIGKIAIDNEEAKKGIDDVIDSGEKAESKLSKLASGAAKVGKGIAVGLAAGATAVAGITAAAVNAFAEFEQLEGGAQLMFGEGFNYIAEQARNAFSTVQMSQNEYLQQANGFAVGLKTALGGNEQAAAELSHKIIQAEADIIAATGNTQENIQNAFNGIMKSNFTMLDNLGLGITPTKEGFQEVIDKVNEWNAANGEATSYQIDNLADCQSALVDYIEMQGMSGYAAKEASGTIQGSLAMVKASWENLLIGFADPTQNISSLIDGLVTSITAFAGNIIPVITNILSGLTQAIAQLAPIISAEIPNLFNQILPGLVEGAVGLVNGLVSALPGILSALTSILPSLVDGVAQVINSLVATLPTLLPQIINGITSLITSIAAALPELVQSLVAALPGILQSVVDAIVTNLPIILNAVSTLVNELVAALPGMIQMLVDALPGLLQSIITAITENLPVFIEAMMSIINGIVTALPQIIQALVDALPTIIEMLITAIIENLPVLIEGIIQMVNGIIEALPVIIEALVAALPTIISLVIEALFTLLPQLVEGVIQLTIGIITALITNLPTIVMALIQAIPAVFQGVLDGIKNVFSPLTEWFSNLWNSLSNVPGLAQLKTMIEQVFNTIKNTISTILNNVKTVVTTAWNTIKTNISTAINAIKTVISSVWEAIKTVVSNVMSGIVSVLKGDWEGVKNSISNILGAIRDVISSVWNAIKSVISSVLSGIVSVVSSVWNSIKSNISSVLSGISSVISSVWNGIKGAISSVLSGIASTVSSAWSNIKSSISNTVNGIKTAVTNGFNNIKTKAINTLKSMGTSIKTIGQNLITGLWNGISSKVDWIISKIKGFKDQVMKSLKSFFGIKSPSIVMRDEVGRMLAEGVAVGIIDGTASVVEATKEMGKEVRDTAKDEAEKTAEELAEERKKAAEEAQKAEEESRKNYLESAQKKLDTYKMYNELTIADEVGFWDVIRQKIKEGTDERISADQKYLDAKKSFNNELLSAEETLQKSLDDIAQKIEDRVQSIMDSFKMFDGVEEEYSLQDLLNGKHKTDLFTSLNNQVADLEDWERQTERLAERIGESSLYEDIYSMGFEALPQIRMLNSLTADELDQYVGIYEKKAEIARRIAHDELDEESFKNAQAAYQTFADKCGEIGVEISDSTWWAETAFANLKETIGTEMQSAYDLVIRALRGMTEAFENFGPRIKESAFDTTWVMGGFATAGMAFENMVDTPALVDSSTATKEAAESENIVRDVSKARMSNGANKTATNAVQKAVEQGNENLVKAINGMTYIIDRGNKEAGTRMREALEGASLKLNGREFARVVKAVN